MPNLTGGDGRRPAGSASESTAPAPARPAFDAVWVTADRIPGWLTRDQARVLWDETRRAGRGAHAVEIGAHQGRSTVVIAAALESQIVEGQGVEQHVGRLTAIDAFVGGERYGGAETRTRLEDHLSALGLLPRVEIVADRSRRVRRRWTGPIDLLWIDGKHDYWTCSDDLRWAAFLSPGRRVLLHDAFSSIGVTLALLAHVLPSRRLRYVGRTGSLAVLEMGAPSGPDRLRILGELPWWLRNVWIKVLLRLRLRRIARWFGHDDEYDPY